MSAIHMIDGPLLVFGGVYSNLPALEALLARAQALGLKPSQMLCTGDIAAYGADARACIELVRSLGIASIAGNCERQLAADADDCSCGYAPGSACEALSVSWYNHARSQIDAGARKWMAQLPPRLNVGLNGLRLAVFHGSLASDNRFVFAATPFRIKAHDIVAAGCDGVIAGHSGLPFTQIHGGLLWHNSGALGMPANDGTPRVWFSILQGGSQMREIRIEHIPLNYDHGAAARAMQAAHLPEDYALTLENGLWPNCDVMAGEQARQTGKSLQAGTLTFDANESRDDQWPKAQALTPLAPDKFRDSHVTANGERRASVEFHKLETLWINTGTLCNLSCETCYIESTPRNDRLVYINSAETALFLDEIVRDGLDAKQIGVTGGEPFLNPHIIDILRDALSRGFEVLVLTNAMKPMRRFDAQLLELNAQYAGKLTLRVSIDHYTRELHELERGPRSWQPAIDGLKWLSEHGFQINIAGRMYSGEGENVVRAGYGHLMQELGVEIDCSDPVQLVLFPEMDTSIDVPEITESCWGLLGKSPSDVMCSNARMLVKRKGADRPAVLACTLLAYDEGFELGATLKDAARSVALNHPHCAKFCVLGGAACSR